MREIKFRGREIMSGELVFGDLCQEKHTDGTFTCVIVQTFATYEVDPDTVGQFTGLYDKNGKEIYEGDIVRWTRYNVRSEYVHNETWTDDCTVYWNDERHAFWKRYEFETGGGASGMLDFKDERAEYVEFEVIGNIHEKEYQDEQ